ncbi:MAG: hypothetical protein WDO74_18925 [Pseudomonadota bacterium]
MAAAPVVAPVSTQPEKPPEEDAQAKSGKLPPTAFWVGVGLTAALGGATLWSGIDTQNNPGPDRVREACKAGSPDCDSLYNEGLDKQHRTNILLGVTAGLGVATAVVGVFFTDWGGSKKSAAAGADKTRPQRLQHPAVGDGRCWGERRGARKVLASGETLRPRRWAAARRSL